MMTAFILCFVILSLLLSCIPVMAIILICVLFNI